MFSLQSLKSLIMITKYTKVKKNNNQVNNIGLMRDTDKTAQIKEG